MTNKASSNDKRARRTEQGYLSILTGVDGELHRLVLAQPAEDDVYQPRRGGIRRIVAPLELARDEADVVVRHGAAHSVMAGHPRLDDHVPALRAAAGAAGDLAQQLEGALRGAEVGEIDADVGIDHTHQRDVREVEPLRDHLGAEQHVHVTTTDAVQDLRMRPLP